MSGFPVPFTLPFTLEVEQEANLAGLGFPSPRPEKPFSYFAYDLLTGKFLGQLPLRGVSFGQQLNTAGQLSASIDLSDRRVIATDPLENTTPNHTLIVADYGGSAMWGGIVQTRKWKVDSTPQNTNRLLEINCVELWGYFASRVQATDYSSPPFSGISGEASMAYWTQTPWDASLIAAQVVSDAIGHSNGLTEPHGNLLGGLGLLINGKAPSSAEPAANAEHYIAVSYPYTSMQTVDTIVAQLAQLGLGVGFDFGVDVVYEGGTASKPKGTVNISYPRRGRTVAENGLMVDLATARGYEFPEDGSQTANRVYEIGGSGAINVTENAFPAAQGYPVWERVISRSNIQSQNVMGILKQTGESDLALYSYAPVTPSVTIGAFDPNCPLGGFTVGDDVQLVLPALNATGTEPWDPRFPNGLNQEWRITGWSAEIKDEGDSVVKLSLAQPPATSVLSSGIF